MTKSAVDSEAASLEEPLVTCGRELLAPEPAPLVSSPLLASLQRAGTVHVYADTADAEELRPLLEVAGGGMLAEVDGNTVNQPLARRVLERYLVGDRLSACTDAFRRRRPGASDTTLLSYLYTMVSGWMGTDLVNAFSAGRSWEVSLQLHMTALCAFRSIVTTQIGAS
jgi:hypothetical protein